MIIRFLILAISVQSLAAGPIVGNNDQKIYNPGSLCELSARKVVSYACDLKTNNPEAYKNYFLLLTTSISAEVQNIIIKEATFELYLRYSQQPKTKRNR